VCGGFNGSPGCRGQELGKRDPLCVLRRRSDPIPRRCPDRDVARARDHFSVSSRIRCDVLAVPHHGGMISPSRCTEPRLTEFYSSTLSIGFAVVSVASENRDRHPFPEHIGALASQTSHVMCTQITNQCHDNTSSLGESVLAADCETPQASERAGEANGVGCAGSVVVPLDGGRIEPRRWKEHQTAVTTLGGKPLCRCSQT